MQRMLVVVAMLSLTACGSKKHDDAAAVAERANPVIVKLRPLVKVVLGNEGDLAAKNKACLEALAVAAPLRTAGFNDSYGPKNKEVGVDDVLLSFHAGAPVDCSEARQGRPDGDCQEWCVKTFRSLSDALSRFAHAGGDTRVERLDAP